MKTSEMKVKLAQSNLYPDTLSQKHGIFTYREEFFYTHGNSDKAIAEKIKKIFSTVTIIDRWQKWTCFRGGASTAQSSHWGIKFKIK